MPSRPCRSLAVVVVALVLVSSLLTATASAVVPPTVYLDQAGLRTAVRPSVVRFREYHSADLHTLVNAAVSGVSWSSWGGAMASGSGQALIQWTDATTGLHAQAHATLPVTVSAAGLQTCGGVKIYTSLVINVAAGATAPPHFAQVQTDREVLPCAVHAGAYVAGQEDRTDPNGCFFKGLKELVIRPPFSLFYCAMHWRGWGDSTTTGTGVARIGFSQYGLRVKLSRVRWCAKWTISYTRETAEVWGAGEAITGMGNVSSGAAARLRGLVGRAGQPHKTVRLTMPSGAGCV
jgi:hypothetical protein